MTEPSAEHHQEEPSARGVEKPSAERCEEPSARGVEKPSAEKCEEPSAQRCRELSTEGHVGVRTLCDFAARRGDLDHRFTPSPSAREGMEGHARVVASRGPGYRSEVAVSGVVSGIRVQGRIDGISTAQGSQEECLEEIKTHRGRLERMAVNQRALHWAQLRAYGALWCREHGYSRIHLALVYLDLVHGKETRFSDTVDAEVLWTELEALCRTWRAWGEAETAHRQCRDKALEVLAFPHREFRPGQRHLAEQVYKTGATGRTLLAQAPTGIGKTLGTLFPMLKAMPYQGLDRIAFLCMKTPGRGVALSALEQLGARSRIPLRVVELIARDKACEYPDKACHGESCPLAQGFYDRLPEARKAAAQHAWLDREGLRQIALKHEVCPYYLGQEMARWCDVAVGDVNHYFDASALLHGLCQMQGWRLGLLVDEAHNLIDRARGMYSAGLDQKQLARLRKSAPKPLQRSLGSVMRRWQELIREQGGEEAGARDAPLWRSLDQLPGDVISSLQHACAAISDYLGEYPDEVTPGLTEWMFDALAFTRLAESFAGHSLCELVRMGRGDSRLGIANVIPADFLAPRFEVAHASVLFSATLAPASYQRDLLGLPGNAVWQEIDSPFAAEQLEVRVCRQLSTRFRDRKSSLPGVVATMAEQYRHCPGHYLAFFSSFAYLEQVRAALAEAYPDVPQRAQRRGMTEQEREGFLESFRPGESGIAFAVLGGAFAEGVDLPGERLIGAFIATLGLPPNEPRQEALKECLEVRFGCGDDYAYRIPGLIKVVQAAGRVIRGPEDSGVVVLMDDRYGRADIRSRLPRWWRPA
uniref:ATP-dependent DNA helicase n=1 Tax=Halomonas sp. TaxID=1486246 RepID=UPI002622D617|nr:ATP-dependent DNA helicase [Halomonas sp.]